MGPLRNGLEKYATGVITPISGVIILTLLRNGRGPPCTPLKLTAKDSENRPKPKKERIVSQPTFFRGKLLVLGSVVGIDSHNGLKVKGRIKKHLL